MKQSWTLKLINGITVASLLGGCAVGPNHRPVVVDTPTKYRNEKGPQSTESLADLAWWNLFKDPVLRGLIEEGLKNNYDLRIAVTRIQQARAQKMQTASAFFPAIGYNLEAQRTQNPATVIPATSTPPTTFNVGGTDVTIPGSSSPERKVRSTPANSFTAISMAQWELDIWGRIRRANESALAQLLAQQEIRRGIIQSLVSDIAQTYFRLLELDAELRIYREAKESFGQSLDLFTKQQQGGIASDLEVARGTASQANAAAAIPAIERQISLVETQLCILLGRVPGPIKRGKSLLAQQMPPRVPAGLPSDLLTRRPDIRQAEQQVRAANAQIGVAIANFLPTFSLTGAAGAVSPELNDLTSGNWNMWSIGGVMSGPLFQGGYYFGRYREAKARWEEAKLNYQKTANAAFGEVANALISRQKYAEARVYQEKQVEALRRAVKLAMDRYTIGVSTYYEVLEAQQQLFPAEIALAQTRANQLNSVVDLYRALGGGWSEARLVAGNRVYVDGEEIPYSNIKKEQAASKKSKKR